MQNTPVKTSFDVHEVAALTRFSKYMLDYLAREQIFEASLPPPEQRHRGVRRRYSYQDLVVLRALKAVCEGGGKVRHLKRALVAFRKEFGHLTPEHHIEKHLVVQGKELCVTDRGTIKQLRDGQLTLALVVDLEGVKKDIAGKVRYNRSSGGYQLSQKAMLAAAAEKQKIWKPIKERRLAMERGR